VTISRLAMALMILVVMAEPVLAQEDSNTKVVRFALVAGNNRGGDDMVELKYAERDATKVASVLRRLGRVRRSNMRVLLNGDPDDFINSLKRLETRIERIKNRKPNVETMLLVYYSGHSKNGSLMMNGSPLPLRKIKSFFASSKADVRIGILDSCRAGEITRLKGGQIAPSFLNVENDLNASGQVLITSSAGDEDSQESDELGGSFFTHYFVSGLRGAADRSGDGAVTLVEAYNYTYNNTVLKTSGTRGGTQHPEYKFDLKGRGNLVLTRVNAERSRLRFAAPVSGDYLVYNLKKGVVVAEVIKQEGEVRDIALAPGNYVIKKRRSHDVLLGKVTVSKNEIKEINDEQLKSTSYEDDYTKGAVMVKINGLKVELGTGMGLQGFFESPIRDDLFLTIPILFLNVDLHNFITKNLSLALDVSLGGRDGSVRVTEDTDVPIEYGEMGLGVGVNYTLGWDWFRIYIGGRLALVYIWRKFKGMEFRNWTPQDFTTVSPGLIAGMQAVFNRHWKLKLEGRVHYLYYNVDGDKSLGYGEGLFAFGYVF